MELLCSSPVTKQSVMMKMLIIQAIACELARIVTNADIVLEGQGVQHKWSTLGWIFLPDKYWNEELYSDYSVLLLLADHC